MSCEVAVEDSEDSIVATANGTGESTGTYTAMGCLGNPTSLPGCGSDTQSSNWLGNWAVLLQGAVLFARGGSSDRSDRASGGSEFLCVCWKRLIQ